MEKEIFVINLLEDKEFDKLPYNNISDSLGFADRETGNAFIRKTHIPVMDAATIQHEIQELIAKNSFHEDEYGIRHKKGKQIFASILPILASVVAGPLGPVAAGLIGAGTSALTQKTMTDTGKISPLPTILSGVGGALGAKAMAPGVAASKAATTALGRAPSYVGQVATGVQQGLGFQSGAQKILGATATPSTISPALNLGISGVSPTGTLLAGSPSTALLGSAPNITSALGSQAIAPITPQISQLPSPPKPPEPFKITPTTALGAASLAGSMGFKQPEFKMPSSVEDIRSKLLAGGQLTPTGLQAQTELANILKSTPQELYPTANDAYYEATLRRTRESYANALEELDKAYNRAGVYGSGEHLAERSSLQEELARTESGISAEIEQRRFELARTTKYQAIQDALNVDKGVMDDLVGLTGLDVQTAAQVYGAKVEDIQQIREALGTLGVEMILRGQPSQFQQGLGTFNIIPAVR